MVFKDIIRVALAVISLAFLTFFTAVLTLQATHSSSPTIASRLVATHSLGGSTGAVIGDDNMLYYSMGADLTIADISNPYEPAVLNTWSSNDKSGYLNIHLDGNYLYLPRSSSAGIEILDVSSSLQPVIVGNIPALIMGGIGTVANAIVTSGNYAYVLQGQLFRVIDISVLGSPIDVTYFQPSGNYLTTITLFGNYAYVSDHFGIRIIDISFPDTPSIVGTYSLSSIVDIERNGSLLYVATSTGVHILDVSVPTDPVEIGVFAADPFNTIRQMTAFGNYIYLNGSFGESLHVIDVSDPIAPVEVANVDVPSFSFGMFATEMSLYAGATVEGMVIVDVVEPSSPTVVGTVGILPVVQGVARLADHVFVASDHSLWLLQLQPAVTTGSEVWSSSLHLGDIRSRGNLLYVAKSDNVYGPGFLEILDVETPGAPVSLGDVQLSIQGSSRVVVAEEYAYVGSWNGISAVNIVEPSAPTETHHVSTSGNVGGLQIQDQYLYAATTGGLLIYDISNPAILTLVGVYPGIFARDVAVVGGFAFVAVSSGAGLRIIDISSPTSPTLVRTINTCGVANAISVSQGFAYVLDGCRQVAMYDVSDPVSGSSFPTSRANIPAFGTKILAEGRDVFVAAFNGGFVKLERLEYASIVIPPAGGTLISPDNTTSVTISNDAFNESVLLRFYEEPDLPAGGLSGYGPFFSLTALETATWQPVPMLPTGTITVTLQYGSLESGNHVVSVGSQFFANDLGSMSVNSVPVAEETLQLYRWSDGAWVTDEILSSIDIQAKQVTSVLSMFAGEETFALLGESFQVYLPMVLR